MASWPEASLTISCPAVTVPSVNEHRPLLAAVPGPVPLAITVDVEPPHHAQTVDRFLPHPRVHGPALPGHVLRHPHVDRQQGADPPFLPAGHAVVVAGAAEAARARAKRNAKDSGGPSGARVAWLITRPGSGLA
jgi:hypothetical protein